jgi:hypothetical protein
MADMKTPVEELAEVKQLNETLAAENESLKARIQAMEEEAEKEKEEDAEDKEEEPKSEDDPKPEEDAEDEEEKDDEVKALAKQVAALTSFVKSPEFRASLVSGSESGVAEGGSESGKTLTAAEAQAEYNKIDPNDAKARAAYREDHKKELGL